MHKIAGSVLSSSGIQYDVSPHENSPTRPPNASAGIEKPLCSTKHVLACRRWLGVAGPFILSPMKLQFHARTLASACSSLMTAPVKHTRIKTQQSLWHSCRANKHVFNVKNHTKMSTRHAVYAQKSRPHTFGRTRHELECLDNLAYDPEHGDAEILGEIAQLFHEVLQALEDTIVHGNDLPHDAEHLTKIVEHFQQQLFQPIEYGLDFLALHAFVTCQGREQKYPHID